MHALILGGARSGKSAYAEARVRAQWCVGEPAPRYVATAEAFDAEMAERIAQHRRDRGENWRTVEAPMTLPDVLRSAADAPERGPILVDCLTLWLSNLLLADHDLDAAGAALLAALGKLTAAQRPTTLVSNEVGFGLVPDTSLGRRFRDAQGRLNQRVAAEVDTVVLMAAGLPLRLKPAMTTAD